MQHPRALRPLALAALVALPLACTEKSKEPTPAAEAAPSPSAPSAGLVMEDRAPRLLSEVGEVDLPPAEAPSSWTAGWRLTPGVTWKGSYRQRIQAELEGQALGDSRRGMEVLGTLFVTPTSEGVADVGLTDARSVMVVDMPGLEERKIEQEVPPKTYVGLLKTGSADEAPEDPLVYAMLAVPSRPSAVGEKVSQRLTMPIDVPEGTLTAEGTATWTLQGFVRCGEHTCAHYAHDVDIQKLTLPEGAKGSYGARAKAIGWTLVDIDEGSIWRHKSATHLRIKAEVSAELVKAMSPHASAASAADDGEPKRMDMAQEHLHEIVRE